MSPGTVVSTVRAYPGPLRDEPLSIELYNTCYATAQGVQDGLAAEGSAAAWLRGVAGRLPAGGAGRVGHDALLELRAPVRAALTAVAQGSEPGPEAIAALNAASARAPSFLTARNTAEGRLVSRLDPGAAGREDIVLAALARDAIALICGDRDAVRACGAPGCVLLYRKSHPRQSWCSAACGNRARQARHYRRSRRGPPGRRERAG